MTKERGIWLNSMMAEKMIATVHPSSILRAPDAAARDEQYREFVADLLVVASEMRNGATAKRD